MTVNTAIDTAAISEAAYHLWQDAGQPHGRDQDFWYQAEAALTATAKPKRRRAPARAAAKPATRKTAAKPAAAKAKAEPKAKSAPKAKAEPKAKAPARRKAATKA